ncbi:MAG: vanadium-dependent haloperoxidase [Gemmatimonadaceae bacterium]
MPLIPLRLTVLASLVQLLPAGEGSDTSRASDASVIATWNATAYEIAFAEDSFRTFKGHRAFAMMHLAMHDAVNAARPRSRPYVCTHHDSVADPARAAAQAAHDVLLAAYPAARARIDAKLGESRRPTEPSAARGAYLGAACAAAIIAARRDDGWNRQEPYRFRDQPGAYRTTPPWNGFVAHAGFGRATPFAFESINTLRPNAPPSRVSREYAVAYDEVKAYGSVDSKSRTPDQTAYAVWWMEFAEGSVNRLARRVVGEGGASLHDAARIFALLNVALYDQYIAVWDAKFTFNHWRPITAIHDAARDGNAATLPDSSWQPLRVTPPFPEYVSAHASACAASFGVLRRLIGEQSFTMETITAPQGMPRRTFRGFDAAAAECGDSRVRLGWHFRYAIDAGLRLGDAVARQVVERLIPPL